MCIRDRCGFALGPGLGTAAVGVYLALGAVGIPVFAGFSGGIGSFVGMTGGYLWAFLPMAFLCGLGARQKNRALALTVGFLGLVVCHLCGSFQFALVSAVSPWNAFLLASAPYLLKDAASLVVDVYKRQEWDVPMPRSGTPVPVRPRPAAGPGPRFHRRAGHTGPGRCPRRRAAAAPGSPGPPLRPG